MTTIWTCKDCERRHHALRSTARVMAITLFTSLIAYAVAATGVSAAVYQSRALAECRAASALEVPDAQ